MSVTEHYTTWAKFSLVHLLELTTRAFIIKNCLVLRPPHGPDVLPLLKP